MRDHQEGGGHYIGAEWEGRMEGSKASLCQHGDEGREAGREAVPASPGFMQIWSRAGGPGRQAISVEVMQKPGPLVVGKRFLQDYS